MSITKKTEKDEYTIIDLGSLSDLSKYKYPMPVPGKSQEIEGKVFLKEQLGLTSAEISVNAMKPGDSTPFIHKHKENEEIYFVIKGNGQMLLNDEVFDISEGSAIRVSPAAERSIRNNSASELIFMVIQAKRSSISSKQIEDGYSIEKTPVWY